VRSSKARALKFGKVWRKGNGGDARRRRNDCTLFWGLYLKKEEEETTREATVLQCLCFDLCLSCRKRNDLIYLFFLLKNRKNEKKLSSLKMQHSSRKQTNKGVATHFNSFFSVLKNERTKSSIYFTQTIITSCPNLSKSSSIISVVHSKLSSIFLAEHLL
jgi:hypothetical protein